MSEHTHKLIELVGSSPKGTDEAIQNALARASATLKNIEWIEVSEIHGKVVNGKVDTFQVKMKVAFRLE